MKEFTQSQLEAIAFSLTYVLGRPTLVTNKVAFTNALKKVKEALDELHYNDEMGW